MINQSLSTLLLAVIAISASTSTLAQVGSNEKVQGQAQEKKEEPKKDSKVEEYEKAIKDLKKFDGQFTFYQRKKDILLELPEKDLKKVFLIQATFNTGSSTNMTQAGDPVGPFETQPFRWEKRDENIWIVRPNLRYRWDKNDPLAQASGRSFPEAVLGSFAIIATHPEKKLYLLNVTSLFYGDFVRLNEIVNMGTGGQYMLDREKSNPGRIKSFPENAAVRMDLYYSSPRGAEPNPLMMMLGLGAPSQLEDDRSLPLSVTYNIWYRQDSGYRARVADPRVGYFTQDFYSLGKFLGEDRTERYINRWNLQKKDPNAAMSEPVKPIVWTIDTSVPKEYREASKEGILRWNRAFEKLGFKNAIVVQDAPENDPEWDHADGRFNVFRWTMSPNSGYAIALARTDPFTGEVLNAGVTMDANMLQFAQQEQQTLGIPTVEAHKRAFSVLTRNPQSRNMTADKVLYGPAGDPDYQKSLDLAEKLGWARAQCRYGSGLRDSAEFAWSALEAVGLGKMAISREQYAKEFITDVVSHEIGHTLGLRHNFTSSTYLSTKDLANESVTKRESISASVMEYTPVNILAILKGRGNFYAPTIGRYDYWAIEYGYTPIDPKRAIGERPTLARIASRSSEPGLAYLTDENADGWNPYAVRFDCAKDPLAYSMKMIEAAKRIRQYAITKLPLKGDSYARRTQLITRSIGATFREGRFAARFVGGVANDRSFYSGKGPNTLAPVKASEQRLAVGMIAKECLSPTSFNLPQEVLLNLSKDANSEDSSGWIAPLREMIGNQQTLLLSMLMSASTTDRIVENEYKLGKAAYSLEEHYSKLMGAVFGELSSGLNVPAVRRDLQRVALSGLMTQAGASQGAISDDVRVVAVDSLKGLSASIGRQLKQSKKLDRLTVLHLRDSKAAVDRFLSRRVSVPR
ncbi:MAG: zinc-dependent metalloprotease [Fimbriimonadaceae bacterium]